MTRYLDQILNPEQTPLAWLTEHLATADQIHAHVGYLDRAGVRLLEAPLRDMLERGGTVTLIVDYRDGHPRHPDIVWLLEMFAPYGDHATVRLARDPAVLHAKVFLLTGADGNRRALVGSANLTAAGLTRNYEACVALEPGDAAIADVERAAAAWLERTAPVDLGMVAAMADLGAPNPTGRSEAVGDLLEAAVARAEATGTGQPPGLPTGFTDLDRLLAGMRPGQVVYVAGRPGLGKSTLVMDVLRYNAVRSGVPSLLMSFEMTKPEIMERLLAAEARVPLNVIRLGQMNDDDWRKVTSTVGRVQDAPLFVNDSCVASLRNVVAEVRRMVLERGIRLVVIDYVQQLSVDRRVENRQEEVAEISRALKRLALELGVPILAVSQLNRAPEARQSRVPQLSDLRSSGSLEQDADAVILIHREDEYDKESPRAGEVDLIVAKNRGGPKDTVVAAAQLHFSRFVDMAAF